MPRFYQPPVAKGPTVEIIFWIVSGRGTQSAQVVKLPEDWEEDEIKDELDQWIEEFSACTEFSYGWCYLRTLDYVVTNMAWCPKCKASRHSACKSATGGDTSVHRARIQWFASFFPGLSKRWERSAKIAAELKANRDAQMEQLRTRAK